MRNATRVVLAACTVLCSLALASGAASAARAIRVEPVGEITKVVEAFTVTAFGGEVRITCRLVMRGRIGPLIAKVRRLPEGRFGLITFAEAEECRNNFGAPVEVAILVEQERPIRMRYEAFLGALPMITGVLFRKLNFEVKITEFIIAGCLFSGPVGLLVRFPPVEEGGGRRFTAESFTAPNVIPLVAGEVCPPEVALGGAGRVTPPLRAALVE